MIQESVCPGCGLVTPVIIDDTVYCGGQQPPEIFCMGCNNKYIAGIDTLLEPDESLIYKVYENGQSD